MSVLKTVIMYAEASDIISVQMAIEAERELDRMETINHQLSDGLSVLNTQLAQLQSTLDDTKRELAGIKSDNYDWKNTAEKAYKQLMERSKAIDEARESMLEADSMERIDRCDIWLKKYPKDGEK